MFWNLFWPIALITLANCFYNICTKSTPEQSAPTLGLAVVALEVGYILTYRAGWKINTASLVTNIALAILLLFIGFLFYGEPITGRKLLGVVICCIGLFFLIK